MSKLQENNQGQRAHTESSSLIRRRHYSHLQAVLWVGVNQMTSCGSDSLEAESTCHKQIQNGPVLKIEHKKQPVLHLCL